MLKADNRTKMPMWPYQRRKTDEITEAHSITDNLCLPLHPSINCCLTFSPFNGHHQKKSKWQRPRQGKKKTPTLTRNERFEHVFSFI